MSADAFLAKLEGVRQMAADRWVARCPSHADKSPSLNIRELPDGMVLVHCFAECSFDDIVESAGLTASALFPPCVADHRVPPQRRPFDSTQVLTALAHEILVVAMLIEDCAEQDAVNRNRLTLACSRFHRALDAIGPLPELAEMRRLRRGEFAT